MVKPTCIHQGVVGECEICKAEDLLDGKVTHINSKKNDKWNNTKHGAIGLVFGALVGATAVFVALIFLHFFPGDKQLQKAQEHVKTVMLIDRNCNECHLGSSFINLFNHPAVNGNDNVVNKMMDNAKIKRW